jgi:dTMP kinase
MSKRGVFICIEGIDTSGKTTHARRLVENLQGKGFDASYTTEPTTGEIGNFIRTRILRGQERVPSTIEALLFAVDRVEHVENTIKPLLQEGKIVISDRYVYSSLAYQGAAGLDLKWIEEINKFAIQPDLAVYLDISAEVVFERLKREKSVMENLETQRKVREIYLKLVEDRRLILINGNRPSSEVEKDVLDLVLQFLESRSS